MITEGTLQAYRTYMESQRHLRTAGGYEQMPQGRPFVTISRQTGVGGNTIGERIAECLNASAAAETKCRWTVFDKNLISQVLIEHDLPAQAAAYMAYGGREMAITDMLAQLFGGQPSREQVARQVSETILNLACLGYAIIVGRGGAVVTQQMPHGVHVRLIGSFDRRVERIMDLNKLSKRDAEERVQREDQGRAAYVRDFLGRDINDPTLYHIVVNTDRLRLEEIARIIGEVILARRPILPDMVPHQAA